MIATAFEDTVIVRSYEGASGIATLTVNKETGSLSYQAGGDTVGTPISINEAGTYTFISGTASNSIIVDIIDYETYFEIISEMETPKAEINL